ncbi:MAG: hypothetical protein PVG89_09430, partial [Gammaproteobacteria bacterium]
MTALSEQRTSNTTVTDIHNLWHIIRGCLQDYMIQESPNGRYARIIAHKCRQFINAVQKLPDYQQQMQSLQTQRPFDVPWLRWRIAADSVMEMELVTVFGQTPPPIHSYDGPVGIVFVVDGELSLYRYSEFHNAISGFSSITRLQCQRLDRYGVTQGTLVDSLTTPVVEMQANTERCIFFDIHLRDHTDPPHYF